MKSYLARIAFEVGEIPFRIFSGEGSGLTPKDYLLKFELDRPPEEVPEEERGRRLKEYRERSQAFWGLAKDLSEGRGRPARTPGGNTLQPDRPAFVPRKPSDKAPARKGAGLPPGYQGLAGRKPKR